MEYLANQEGSTAVEQIRRAIGDHRAAGYNPTVLAVDPTTAADLDLFATGADNAFAFPLGSYGASSPLFDLAVAENAGVTDPTLIDPLAVGTLCLGPTAIEVDRSHGLTKNTSIVRLEASVLMVVRNPEAITSSPAASAWTARRLRVGRSSQAAGRSVRSNEQRARRTRWR